jgi:hypothetical protein
LYQFCIIPLSSSVNQSMSQHRGILRYPLPVILNSLFDVADWSCDVHERVKMNGSVR